MSLSEPTEVDMDAFDMGDEGDDDAAQGGDSQGGSGDSSQGGKPAEPDWRQPIEDIRRQQEQLSIQLMSALAQMKQPGPAPVLAPVDKKPSAAEMWQLAHQVPEVMPQVIETQVSSLLDGKLGEFEKRLFGTLEAQKASQTFSDALRDYDDDIRNATRSKIVPAMAETKKALESLLAPEFRGTNVHETLAYLLAAAKNPRAVAEREVSRSKAAAESRAAAKMRASGAAVGGRAAPELKITEEMEEVGRRLGLNMKDEKVRARILNGVKSERIAALDNGNLVRMGGE